MANNNKYIVFSHVKKEIGNSSPCSPADCDLIWSAIRIKAFVKSHTCIVCCQRFPESRILLERSTPCRCLLCVAWMRKLSMDVRAEDLNPSRSFQHYQLHSSPILSYQMTFSAILCHSFPHSPAWLLFYPVPLTASQARYRPRSLWYILGIKVNYRR